MAAKTNYLRDASRRPLRYLYRWAKTPSTLAEVIQALYHVSQRTQAVYLGDHLALIKTVYGAKMYVNTRDVGVSANLLLDGVWERHISEVFRRLVKPGMNVLEVGANLGFYTLQAAELCGSEGRVWAFEANPATLALLNRNVYANGFFLRVETIAKIAHEREGEIEFHILDSSPGSSSIGEFADQDRARMENLGATFQTLRLPTSTVDACLPQDVKIDVVKIDAEGSEPFVWRGMKGVLARNPDIVVLIEFYPRNFAMTQTDPLAFLDELQSAGFILRCIEGDGRVVPVSASELMARRSSELLLSRRADFTP